MPVAEGSYPCWLIVESQRGTFWRSVDSTVQALLGRCLENLPQVRVVRPCWVNQWVEECMKNRDKAWLGLDTHYEMPQNKVHQRNMYPELNRNCLRLRVDVPMIHISRPGAGEELTRLVKQVIDPEHRPVLPVEWKTLPPMLQFGARLMTILNPELDDGGILLRNLGMFAAQYAVMHGREKLGEQDHLAVYRLMRDSVRKWVWRVVEHLAQDGYVEVNKIWSFAGVRQDVARDVLSGLHEAGMVRYPRGRNGTRKRKWVGLTEEWGPDITQFVEGELKWW